jgi:hypothetical protein
VVVVVFHERTVIWWMTAHREQSMLDEVLPTRPRLDDAGHNLDLYPDYGHAWLRLHALGATTNDRPFRHSPYLRLYLPESVSTEKTHPPVAGLAGKPGVHLSDWMTYPLVVEHQHQIFCEM